MLIQPSTVDRRRIGYRRRTASESPGKSTAERPFSPPRERAFVRSFVRSFLLYGYGYGAAHPSVLPKEYKFFLSRHTDLISPFPPFLSPDLGPQSSPHSSSGLNSADQMATASVAAMQSVSLAAQVCEFCISFTPFCRPCAQCSCETEGSCDGALVWFWICVEEDMDVDVEG